MLIKQGKYKGYTCNELFMNEHGQLIDVLHNDTYFIPVGEMTDINRESIKKRFPKDIRIYKLKKRNEEKHIVYATYKVYHDLMKRLRAKYSTKERNKE